jgi:hypothetical protein
VRDPRVAHSHHIYILFSFCRKSCAIIPVSFREREVMAYGSLSREVKA